MSKILKKYKAGIVEKLSAVLGLVIILLAVSLIFSPETHAASFTKPLECGAGPNLNLEAYFLIQPAVKSLGINQSSAKTNLVISIHGFKSSANSDFQALAKNSAAKSNGAFDYRAYDWKELADGFNSGKKSTGGTIPYLEQAQRVGRCIAYDVANSKYTYVHIIGHSLGATVADSMSDKLTELVGSRVKVSITGLDAYIGIMPQPFGENANFVDHYFARGGIDGSRTDWIIPNACNVDTTTLMTTSDNHGWPIKFYLQTISNPLKADYLGLGFAWHKEYTGSDPTYGKNGLCFKGQIVPLAPCTVACGPNPSPMPSPTPTPSPSPSPSTGTSCTTPIITQPVNNGDFASGAPVTIKWTTNCSRSYFEITGGPYSSPQTAGWISSKEYTYSQGLWSGPYNLRVKGRDSLLRQTAWSTTISFTIGGIGGPPANPPTPSCSGNAVVTDTTNICAGISDTSCHSLTALGLVSLKSVAPASGWTVIVSSQTDCSDNIGQYHQNTDVDSGVSAAAKSVRLEVVLPTDCPALLASGGIKTYRDLAFSENGGCRNVTLSQGGIPSFPAVGYPTGPRSLKFFGDHIDSAKVTVYSGENYTGTSCATYTQDVSDFLGCSDKVISMKVEPYTAPVKAKNIASDGSWDLDMSAATDTDPATYSLLGQSDSAGVVFPTSQKILGLVIHDRPGGNIQTIYVGFGGGESGNVIIDNIDMISAGVKCVTLAPFNVINARWATIKIITSGGNNGFSDMEIFAADGGTMRANIACPQINTTNAKPGVSAPPKNWVEPTQPTLQTPTCDSQTLFLYVVQNDSFSDKCPGGNVTAATDMPCGTAVNFNGSRSIVLPDNPKLNNGKLSISVCAKVGNKDGARTLFRREMGSGGNDQFTLEIRDGGKLSAKAYCYPALNGTVLVPDGWQVYGLIVDSPSGTLSTTIDGVIINTIPAPSPGTTCPTWTAGTGPLVLGNNREGHDYFVGDIAWLKVTTP